MSEEQIKEIFQIFKNTMRKFGRNICFPSNTDPQKTYQWRYISHFTKRINEWKIEGTMVNKMINEIAQYAHDQNLLDRGAAILAKDNILDICHRRLKMDLETEKDSLKDLKKSVKTISDFHFQELCKTRRGKFPLIVALYDSGKISQPFLALSEKCWKAILLLKDDDAELLPSLNSLLRLRLSYLNRCGTTVLREILGSDLMETI